MKNMSHQDYYIVGVGASAGGQDALKDFFSGIPVNVQAAFVIVTHLLRDHKSALPHIISKFTKLPVAAIEHDTKPRPGHVYVMTEDVIATMKRGKLILNPRPGDNRINNSIDIFFESLAVDQRTKAIGVILSGMGKDGADGALKIFQEGGDVFVQDPGSTKFSSMPAATIFKDHPDFILPPRELGVKLGQMIQSKTSGRFLPDDLHQENRLNLNT
jgi:two-component system, chemotaxis family, protein-glutamate methylesterase/glutaminase